jgi:hypothetical protein
LIGISDEFLKETWDKAETLMSTQGSVVKAPGFDGLFVQHSPTTTEIDKLIQMDYFHQYDQAYLKLLGQNLSPAMVVFQFHL